MAINPSDLSIRYTLMCDSFYLKKWLQDPTISRWFPIVGEFELEDAVKRWIDFSRCRASLTAIYKGNPCGIATLYYVPYKKMEHQAEFGIIVGQELRNLGIGKYLLEHLMTLAKQAFNMELLHLQVYEGNPAYSFYRRMGFTDFGKQDRWLKEPDGVYSARIFMERYLDDISERDLSHLK